MKLPSLIPVAWFAGGILLTVGWKSLAIAAPRVFLLVVLTLLIAGYILLCKNRILTAVLAASGAWLFLGVAAASLEHTSAPANLASELIEGGKLDSQTALRWRGRLRSDPLSLPWGKRYEVDLEEVETTAGITPVKGGLRLTYYEPESPGAAQPPGVQAGDRVEVLARARPVTNFANPGNFDFRGYLARQNIQLQASLRNGQLLSVVDHPRPSVAQQFARLRGRFLATLDDLFKARPEEGALARAMLLGDRSFVERDRVVDFQKTGVYHVLVLAGLHVGALAAFFLWAGRRLRIGLTPRVFLTLAALAAYACTVEERPPILRAVIMAAVFLCAKLLYRRMDLVNVAAVSALLILVARPSELSDASFLLSYSAVAMIGAIAIPCIERSSEPYRMALDHLSDVTRDVSHAPKVIQFRIELRATAAWIAARMSRLHSPLGTGLVAHPLRAAFYFWELLFISAILQLGMLPPLAYFFHRVTLAGPLANVPAVLLTGVAVPLGFLTLGAALVSRVAAGSMAKLLALILAMLDAFVRWFASWTRASYRIPGPSVAMMALFVVLAIALSAALRMRWKVWWAFGTSAALVGVGAVIATHPFPPDLQPQRLELTVLDVGQGDSLFVSFPRGRTMLVDAGGELGSFHAGGMRSGIDVGEEVVSPYLWSRGLKKIDVVALTHAHEDHLGGLTAIFENFRVDEFWVGRDIRNAAYEQILALAQSHGARIRHLKQSDSFSEDGVAGRVLWPDDLSESKTAKNDDSLVLRLSDGAETLLLAGDIERPSERKLLAEEQPLSVNFLKVAHHGSKTSTTDAFLSAAHPAFAAISVGRDNLFGHPSAEVTDRLEAAGVRIYRTDRDGAITASTDGRSLILNTFLNAEK